MTAPVRSTTFLLGAARSGTSLLYQALCLHPTSVYFNNWMRLAPRHPAVSLANRVPRHSPRLRRRFWFGEDSNAYVYSRRRHPFERLYPRPIEGEPIFASCGVDAEVSTGSPNPETLRALRRVVTSTARWGGGKYFISKRITNNRRIAVLQHAFPDSRFIVITRDGRAVALSLSRVAWWEDRVVWWCGETPCEWRERGGDPWELCARNWVEEVRVIDAGLDVVPSGHVLHITYEEIVADPLPTLLRVGAFAGLDQDPSWINELNHLRFPNRNSSWRSNLEPDALARIESIQGNELQRRGYR